MPLSSELYHRRSPAEIEQALQRLSKSIESAKQESGLDEDALSLALNLSQE